MAERFQRAGRLLWRVLPGMVMTQRMDGDPGAGAAELTGVAAAVWLLLEVPADIDTLADEAGCSPEELCTALGELVSNGLVVPASDG
ncbi:MAG: hypothetical protein RI900_1400 [Actinomycetota bacterium]|jgi:hypothetical protein